MRICARSYIFFLFIISLLLFSLSLSSRDIGVRGGGARARFPSLFSVPTPAATQSEFRRGRSFSDRCGSALGWRTRTVDPPNSAAPTTIQTYVIFDISFFFYVKLYARIYTRCVFEMHIFVTFTKYNIV